MVYNRYMYQDIIVIVITSLCMFFIWYFSKKDTYIVLNTIKNEIKKEEPIKEIAKVKIPKKPILPKEKVNSFLPIEGIGPKINKLLHESNIKTFDDLSNAKVLDLQEILDNAGNSFNMANPKTWGEQAKLAKEKKWDELKEFRKNLHINEEN